MKDLPVSNDDFNSENENELNDIFASAPNDNRDEVTRELNSIETVASDESMPDPVFAGRYLAEQHAIFAKMMAAPNVPSLFTVTGALVIDNNVQSSAFNQVFPLNLACKQENLH